MTDGAANKHKVPEPVFEREPPTWGEEFRQAFAHAKRLLPVGEMTYQVITDRVSRVVPVHQTTIVRLGQLDHPPSTPSQRQMAFLALTAMGYDPEEFGLTYEDRALAGVDEKYLREVLHPKALEFGDPDAPLKEIHRSRSPGS